MDAAELFQGIAVIFDDEINDTKSVIFKIKENIQRKNIPVAGYEEMPRTEMISSLSKASFIILDWDYTNSKFHMEADERLLIPRESQEEELIGFIRELLSRTFIPVFIFTSKSVESIKEILSDVGLWENENENVNRIFIKQKDDVYSETQLFDAIETWLKSMPSVYVLKEWEKNMSRSKDAMFLDLYNCSPNWVKIIWDMIKEDTIENYREFGEFVTRTLHNRMGEHRFDESIIDSPKEISAEELQRVVEGERYLTYKDSILPQQAYTGDLFKDDKKYYLNIRAQCDLSRMDKHSNEYNPLLYCIEGKKLQRKDIITNDIRLTGDGFLVFGNDEYFSLDEISEFCKDDMKLQGFNKKFTKHRDRTFFRKGALIGRNDKVIIGCVAGEQVLQFKLDISIKEFNLVKDKRIGRILPPYITCIQQKCSQNMIREGTMPIPKELFMSFED